MWRPRLFSPACPSKQWSWVLRVRANLPRLRGEVRSNLLTQAMKNTKTLALSIALAGKTCILHEGQCSRSLGTHEKWSFRKAEWRTSRFVNFDRLSLQLQDDPCNSRNKEPPMCLGEVLQASKELKFQNFRHWEAQTADKGTNRLWLALPKSSDLSEIWGFGCKKKSNVYLRVTRHA